MKPNRKTTLAFALSLSLALLCVNNETMAAVTKIYLSPKGNDANPGSKDLPLATLKGAVNKLRTLRTVQSFNKTVQVIIGDGDYYLSEPIVLGPDDSGTDKAPIIFCADKGAHPVFLGGKKISGFEKVSDQLWRVHVPEVSNRGWYFEQLYVNGRRATRAKSPNSGFYFLKDVSERIVDKGTGRIPNQAVQRLMLFPKAVAHVASFSKDDFNDAVMTLYHKWDNTRKHITAFEQDSSVVFTTGTGMQSWNMLDTKTRYILENYKAALDTCGEWYLDRSGSLFYMPLPGESIKDLVVIAPVAEQLILLQGNESTGKKVENIRFEGLSFQVAGYSMPKAGNEAEQAAAPIEAVVMADYARNIQLINCEIAHTGTNAIWFRNACIDCRIQHCYLHDLGAGGVKIGNFVEPVTQELLTRNIVVDNNIITSGGYVFPCAVGVTLFHASDNQITHNEIADFRYSGVSVGWVWGYAYSATKRNKIEFNHIHHIGWGELCDMGGVYCLGQSEGTSVSNNVIHHIYSFDYGGWGLYTDEGSTGIVMENNLVYNCKNSGFHQHYGRENFIRNNIFANNMKAQLQATRIEEHLSFTFTHNIVSFSTGDLLTSNWSRIRIQSDSNSYWDTRTPDVRFAGSSFADWQKSGKDVHSILADPEFVDPANFDFRVMNKSLMHQIGFKAFDYSKAGVYGSKEWKKLALFDPAKSKAFDEAIRRNESRTR